MEGLYRLLSLIVSLAGFTVVAGALLIRGESLFTVATRGVLAFTVLWVVQSAIGGIFKLAASSERRRDGA
jgi:hypothetical protein